MFIQMQSLYSGTEKKRRREEEKKRRRDFSGSVERKIAAKEQRIIK